jgi:hypothetical protein
VPQARDHHGALIAPGLEIHRRREALDRAQPVARAARGREPVVARAREVRDAGAAIGGDRVDRRHGTTADAKDDVAATAMADQVGRQLGDDDRRLAAVTLVEAQVVGQLLDRAPRWSNTGGIVDADADGRAQRHVATRTTVPSVLLERTSNSPTRRRAPPNPSPRP